MDHKQVQDIATKHGLGRVYFQFNFPENSGRQFEVGYVSNGRQRELFCKRGSNSNPDQFYLCNKYANLDRAEMETARNLLVTIKNIVDGMIEKTDAREFKAEFFDNIADACMAAKKTVLVDAVVDKEQSWEESEIAIYEAQGREDARALAEGREPRLISRMEDIKDLEEAG